MNTREVAQKLDTDPKRLRRFLRADNTYRNAGQGGHYEFTEKDLPTLKKRFAAWAAKNAKPAPTGTTEKPASSRSRKKTDEIPPMDVSIAGRRRLTTAEREKRDALSRARVDRLEAQLLAAGLHISQSHDRTKA